MFCRFKLIQWLNGISQWLNIFIKIFQIYVKISDNGAIFKYISEWGGLKEKRF